MRTHQAMFLSWSSTSFWYPLYVGVRFGSQGRCSWTRKKSPSGSPNCGRPDPPTREAWYLSFRSQSEGFKRKLPRTKNKLKFPNEQIEAKTQCERSEATSPKRKFPSGASQAKDPKRKMKPKDPERELRSNNTQAKDPHQRRP